MTTPAHTLVDELTSDLAQAREDLIAARLAQQAKDTPASRATVARSRDRVDALLDLHLELSDPRRWDADQLPTFSTVSIPASSSLT
jgi:two-component sensor histidine kinase